MLHSFRLYARILLATLILAGLQSFAVEAQQGLTKIRSIEGVSEYRLDNGLQVLLIPDQSKATITVNITYLVGSRHESYGETGAAHLLEHMVFKGTPTFPNVPKALNDHGASWNGTTWTDRTNYYETMPASDENLDFGLHIEADRMVNSFVRKSDLDSEMTVVRNEFELGENFPTNVLSERMISAAYLFHGYGHSTIGARSDIESIPITRLQNFYRSYYQPDNAILVVAGRFDESKALALIQKYFGAIPKPERELPPFYTAEPAQDGERSVMLRRVGDVAAFGAVYHIPGAAHPDMAAIEVLGRILADTPSGRLYKALVETQKAVSVSAFPFQWREPSVLQFMAEIREEKSIDDVRETMLPIIEGVTQSGVTEEEVARARNAILKNKDLLLAESESFAIEMSEWAAMGDWRLFFVNRDLIKAVTPEQGRAVAEKYLRRNNRTIGTYIPTDQPERVEIPPVGDIQAMAAKYTPATTTLAEAEVFDPTPTNLESRARRETLTNGMKLGLLPKETRQDRVVAELRLAVANEKDLLQDRRHLNDFVADMLMRGTKQHTRQQIKDELDRLKARVQISGGTNTTGVSIETTHENLPAVVRLVIEMLREPSFDPKEFELLKEEKLAQLEQQRSEPLFLGFRAIQHHLFPKDHINYIPTVEEEIEQTRSVTLDQVRTFYQQYYGAGVATWSVVGDFDTKEFDQLCRQGLGQWTSSKPSQRVVAVYPGEAKAVNESINTPDKANALIVVGMNLAITRDDPDYPALVLANHILGGEALSSRLATRIRQKEGLSYGVSSIIQTGLQGNAGIVAAFAIAAPQNIQKVEQALFEELNKALQEGFAADEVEKGKESYLKEQKVNLARDSWLASRMNDDLVRERTFQALAEWEAKINALTARVVNQAFRKYVDPKKLAVFKAGDFAPRQ